MVLPDDVEALQATDATTSQGAAADEAMLKDRISANPSDVESLLMLAERRMGATDFDGAETLLAQASAVGGGDLRVREAWETLSLARSERRLQQAREAAERNPDEGARELVVRLLDEHERLALGVAHSRAERFPQDGRLKLDLARRLKRGGNYSGAVQRLEELRRIGGFERTALVELGECWQHLRQFEKALGYYREAIGTEELAGGERDEAEADVGRRALYRGAVLAEALGRGAEACGWYEVLVALGGYKDASERLDKLRPICDKNGFSPG